VFVFGVMLYTTVVIPGIRTVADPIEEETRQDQTEALRVLAAGNTLIVICLGLVIALQAGQEWARRTEAKALADAAATAPAQQQQEVPVAALMEVVPEKS
jgi:imidazoleglycerol phosphate synthase glutamine amidotransferase subunit HisH